MRYSLFFLISIVTLQLHSQAKYDNNWLFGNKSFPGEPGFDSLGTQLSFNDSLTIFKIPQGASLPSSHAMISSASGQLLFYTDGCDVYNMDHEIMENGQSLNPGEVHNIQCNNGYSSGEQSILILPDPRSDQLYHIFHKRIFYVPEIVVLSGDLLQTTVDFSKNPLGKVIEKNKLILQDTFSAGAMTACKHQNGKDWWIITAKDRTKADHFYSLLLTDQGIIDTVTFQTGLAAPQAYTGGGQVSFSPDGRLYVNHDPWQDLLLLFDFDRTSGMLAFREQLFTDEIDIRFGGVAISSNNRFLYVSTRDFLYQYDLEAPSIQDSKVLIDEFDGVGAPFPASLYQMQLAPDCKIYMNSTNSVWKLHVIHNPNEKGLACNFEQRGIDLLGNTHGISLPSFPNYRLDTPYPVCDSTIQVITATSEVVRLPESEVTVFPNPATDQIQIQWQGEHIPTKVRIYSIQGTLLSVHPYLRGRAISTVDLPAGMYIMQLTDKDEVLGITKFFIID